MQMLADGRAAGDLMSDAQTGCSRRRHDRTAEITLQQLHCGLERRDVGHKNELLTQDVHMDRESIKPSHSSPAAVSLA